jgi:DNA polymerase epsilon subunit 3
VSISEAGTVIKCQLSISAHEIASGRSHKTISAADVIKALEILEFGDIAKTLQGELESEALLHSCG